MGPPAERQDPAVRACLLYGVWGSGAGDVFAMGEVGTILHCNGTAYQHCAVNGHVVHDAKWQ
jgi:hypothetical protein